MTDVSLYRTDPDLESLRRRDDFRQLIRSLGTSSEPGSR